MTRSKPSLVILDLPKKQTSIRLSNSASRLRDQLADRLGLSKSAVLELAIRELFRKELR